MPTNHKNIETRQKQLQVLYNTACWYGYATDPKGKRWNKDLILSEAMKLGFQLNYPAVH